jgi:SAM-dependent methyltransferase
MSDIPWYEAFFGEDYLRVYAPFLPPEKTARDVEGILRLLALAPDSALLDLCCGYGRHAIPLSLRGYRVTGLDLSEALLHHAQLDAEKQGAHLTFIQSDMRTIPFENEFAAIINIFTSFGYLETEQEDQTVLQQVARALRPNGLFLLETVYQPRVLRAFTPHGIIRYPNGMIVLEERHIDLVKSRNEVRVTVLNPDRRREYTQSMRIYTLTELIRMLAVAGLHVEAYYGDLDGATLTLDSRLVILARKHV